MNFGWTAKLRVVSPLEIRDLIYMVAVATEGNFTRAAKSLGVNSSTISRRVSRFEDEIGLSLFERGRTGARLTPGGRAILFRARRILSELETIKRSGAERGSGCAGEVRLGVRMPPIGEPLCSLLSRWRKLYPRVVLTLCEMNERDIQAAVRERRLDAALMTSHTLWPGAIAEPLYRERLLAVLPEEHLLASRDTLDWATLRNETFLVQGWDDSQSAREFYSSFMGSGVSFSAHPASKQSVFALVGAGFGVTLATMGQSQVVFPGVVYRPITDADAWLQIELTWFPEAEDATVGRFVAFMRDEARSRGLWRSGISPA